MRRGVLLDLGLTNKGLFGDVKVEGSLGCRGHEMADVTMLCERSKTVSRITILEFRRADFGLFKYLLGRIPRIRASEGRGAQESWLIFKHHFLQAQNWSIHMSK